MPKKPSDMDLLMKSSDIETTQRSLFYLRRVVTQTQMAKDLYGDVPSVSVPVDLLATFIEAWELLNTRLPEEFPVLFSGPGRHPDHPTISCVECGHKSNCATHNSPAYLDGPCNCKGSNNE